MTLEDIHLLATTEFGFFSKTLVSRRSYWTLGDTGKPKHRVFRISHNLEGRPTEIKLAVSSRPGHEVFLPSPFDSESLRKALAGELSQLDVPCGTQKSTAGDAQRSFLKEIIGPVEGQYLRPWMTRSPEPMKARVFTVGFNPATPYPAFKVGAEDYVTALLNNDGEACERFHAWVTGTPSATRRNIDGFVDLLKAHGIVDVVQTNAVCYATPNADALRRPEHRAGHAAGRAVFEKLLLKLRPRVLVVFGSNTIAELKRVCDKRFAMLAPCSARAQHPPCELSLPSFYPDGGSLTVLVIRSLALPGYNAWHGWADEHLDAVAQRVAHLLTKP